MSDAPRCPTHPDSRVVRDGHYGVAGHERQRWKCFPEHGRPHLVRAGLTQQAPATGACPSCERPWRPGEGLRTPRHFTYPTRQIAAALVAAGQGAAYREAGRRARRAAGRLRTDGQTGLGRPSDDAGLVARWVSSFAPVVAGAHAPRAWPDVVLLDHLAFHTRDLKDDGTRKPSGRLLFSVLAAGGYTDEGRFVLLGMRTADGWKEEHWTRFLTGLGLEGGPEEIALDGASGQRLGAASVWGAGSPDGPVVWSCHHHLEASLLRALGEDKRTSVHDPLVVAARKALGGRAGWRAFRAAAAGETLPKVAAWIADNGAVVSRQVARLHGPASVGALELALRRVKTNLFDRRFGFTNRTRTDALLELMRLHQNGLDDERAYAEAIEEHLRAHAGRPARALAQAADPLNRPSLPSRMRKGAGGRRRRRLHPRGMAADQRRASARPTGQGGVPASRTAGRKSP